MRRSQLEPTCVRCTKPFDESSNARQALLNACHGDKAKDQNKHIRANQTRLTLAELNAKDKGTHSFDLFQTPLMCKHCGLQAADISTACTLMRRTCAKASSARPP